MQRAVRSMLFVGPTAILATAAVARRWLADDAYIDLRVVQQILAGNGPVFNVGERVEAFTNPLWVALLTLWGAVGGSLEVGAIVLGVALSAGGLLLAQHAATGLSRGGDATADELVLPLGSLILAALPPMWDFATSGLETGLSFAWLGASFWMLTRRARQLEGDREVRQSRAGSRRVGALLLGLGPLIRPDLALFSLFFGAALFLLEWRATPTRRRAGMMLSLVGWAATLPVLYQVFRMGYFAAWLPNTALAKEAGVPRWMQGWHYVSDLLDAYWLGLPLAVGLGWTGWQLSARRRFDAIAMVTVSAPLAALAHAIYIVRAGGDFMHARLLLPSVVGLLLPVAAVRVPASRASLQQTLRHLAAGVVVVWAGACALEFRIPYEGRVGAYGIADERGYYVRMSGQSHPVAVSDYAETHMGRDGAYFAAESQRLLTGAGDPRAVAHLDLHQPCGATSLPQKYLEVPAREGLPPGVTLVAVRRNIGVTSFLAGLSTHLVDCHGLSDPIAGRLGLDLSRRQGHQKTLGMAWTLARFGAPSTAGMQAPAISAAREALGCGELRRLLAAIEQPLTFALFLENVRASLALTRLRIPDDPSAARERFCPQR